MTKEILRIKAVEELIKMLEEIEQGKKASDEAIKILAMAFKNILKNALDRRKRRKTKELNFYI